MSKPKTKFTSIGGQALLEGIMMKGPTRTAISCRLPDKSIKTEELKSKTLRSKNKFFRIPLVRGITGFIDSMVEGYKALMISAENTGEDFAEEELSPFEKKLTNFFGDKLMSFITGIASVLGVALALVLFFLLPILMFNGLQFLINTISGHEISIEMHRALFEGVIKIAIFVLYVALVSKMKEIRRVFEYHGAEHKTIFCYEANMPLTVENVRKQSRFHPRCGTSFIIVMLLISIVISFIISYFTTLDDNTVVWFFVKILMIPLMMALGYEFIKYAGKHDNLFTRIASRPGLWMQRLTTKEPDDDQIEVAITAFNAVDPDKPSPFENKENDESAVGQNDDNMQSDDQGENKAQDTPDNSVDERSEDNVLEKGPEDKPAVQNKDQ